MYSLKIEKENDNPTIIYWLPTQQDTDKCQHVDIVLDSMF